MAHKIRTLVIEDSAFMRIVISDLLRRDGSIEVVGTATNGLDGVKKAMSLLPDVIVTDMVMPEFDGLYVVQQVMKHRPVPIILLSALDRADQKIFVALNEGAFDFMDKPTGKKIDHGYDELALMVHEASAVGLARPKPERTVKSNLPHQYESHLHYDIICFGASTGGPGAVEHILNNLPANLPVPVVIAQHMPPRFIETFAERLNNNTRLAVTVAMPGEHLISNHIYLAAGGGNMRIHLNDGVAQANYVTDTYAEFNHPSIDCLFESVAENFRGRAIGVVLTGMGKDGSKGLSRIKESGGLTIVQDEATSVVYGMPKMAFENGASMYQLSLSEIPNFIVSAL